MTLKNYLSDWCKVFDFNILTSVFRQLDKVCAPNLICPCKKDIFKAFKLCEYNNLKCIIVGQDPYPQKGVATGLAFANNKEDNLSPSLDVLKECAINYEIPHNLYTFDNSLEEWAKQGVLLLNTALTCKMNEIGSHTMIWRPFISSLFKNISELNTGIVYLLLGSQAQTFTPYINHKTNYIIKEKHPSWYARTNTKMPYEVFTDINDIIYSIYGYKISWYNEI